MLLLGCTRLGVAINQLCPQAQNSVAYQVITNGVTTHQLSSPRARESLPDHDHFRLQFPSIIQFGADSNASTWHSQHAVELTPGRSVTAS